MHLSPYQPINTLAHCHTSTSSHRLYNFFNIFTVTTASFIRITTKRQHMRKILLLTTISMISVSSLFAQRNKAYLTSGGDGGILSFSTVKRSGQSVSTIPRFTTFFNFGTNVHYDFTNNIGVFTGFNVKNIGLIMKDSANTRYKRRLYTLGIPVGIKLGNMNNGNFFFAGAEAGLAVNYKEKKFVNGDKKDKFNEWFSDRTPKILPSVFAGIRTKGVNLKFQYYLNDFLNSNFSESVNGVTSTPYRNLESSVFFVTLGYDLKLKSVLKRKKS
jgi:hypothetical protein